MARSTVRQRAGLKAMKKMPRGTVTRAALSRQAKDAARERGPRDLKRAARVAVGTKGPELRRQAARKAARTRARRRAR